MAKNTTVVQSGNGAALLTALFVILKVTGYITWSWWLVLAPMWAGLAIFLAVMIVILVCAGLGLLAAALLS